MAENKQENKSKTVPVEKSASEKSKTTATKNASSSNNTISKPKKKPRIVSASKVEGTTDGKVTIKKNAKVAEHITEDLEEPVIVVNADHEETKASKELAKSLRNAYGQSQTRKSKAKKQKEEASDEATEQKEDSTKTDYIKDKLNKTDTELTASELQEKPAVEDTADDSSDTKDEKESTKEEKEDKKKKGKITEPPKNFAELMSVLSEFDDEEQPSNSTEDKETVSADQPVEDNLNSTDQYAGYALADDFKQTLADEQNNNSELEQGQKGETKKLKRRIKNTKSNGEYKPPFYQNFKFWMFVVIALCLVALVTVIIVISVRNSQPKYPTGFIFETQQNGAYTEQSETDIYVYNTVSQTNGVKIRVKFDGNFSGQIKISVVQSGIASVDKDLISNGDTITVTPKYLEGTGGIREAVGGLTSIEARYGSVYGRMNILFDKQLSDITISAKMSEADEQALQGYERKYYVSRELTLEAETYYGAFGKELGNGYKADAYGRKIYWSSSNPRIASVDSEGRVTSYRAGTVEFYARAQEYYSPDYTTALKRNTQKFEITFSDIPVASIMLKDGDEAENFSLWLSDPDALTIDLKECINIATDGKKAPLNFSADYLYENAELAYFNVTNDDKVEDINLPKNSGAGVFNLFDTETSHEGKTIYLNVEFGDNYKLSTFDTNHPIKVDIYRSKNFVVKLRDRTKDSANIEFLSFDKVETDQKVLYTNKSLLNLFDLEIKEAVNGQYTEEKTVNNFVASRDIAFVAEDKFNNNFYELQYKTDSGHWYFVPKKDCLTSAIVDGDGFAIRAYLKDINTKDSNMIDGYAKIDGSESDYLTIKVVAPNPRSNSVVISGQSKIESTTYNVSKSSGTLNLYEEFLDTIKTNSVDNDAKNNGLCKISISGATTSDATISYSDLLSANNIPTAKKVYLRLTTHNDSAIYAGVETVATDTNIAENKTSRTKVGLNDHAEIGSIHYLTLEFRYVYDIDLIETGRPEGSNEEVIKSLTIKIKVVE